MSLEDVEIGNHKVVEGIDSSNMPTQLYQFIQVGIFDDDADGDGIPDDIDKCQFITEWYDEQQVKIFACRTSRYSCSL